MAQTAMGCHKNPPTLISRSRTVLAEVISSFGILSSHILGGGHFWHCVVTLAGHKLSLSVDTFLLDTFLATFLELFALGHCWPAITCLSCTAILWCLAVVTKQKSCAVLVAFLWLACKNRSC